MTKLQSILIGSKSATETQVDPFKYNRGQVIHQNSLLESCNVDTARVSTDAKSYKRNVVENTICVDWFQAYITVLKLDLLDQLISSNPIEEIQVSDDVFFVYSGNGTKHFQKLYRVYLYGVHYANIEVDTRCPRIFDYDAAIIKLNNEVLYTSSWLDDFKYILADIGGWVKSTSRFDIAVDGSDKPIRMLNKWLKGRTLAIKGKAAITPRYRNDKTIESVIVGSAKSDKQVSIYNKPSEIKASNKTYITGFWKNNGMDVSDDITRVELRMGSKIANRYDWTRFDDPEYLASILKTELKNYLEFYYIGKDSNKHRAYKNKSMEIINFDSIGGKLLDKRENKPPSDVYRAKQTVKNALREEYINGNDTIPSIIREYSLSEWLDTKLPYWVAEWEKERKIRAMTVDIRESSN